MIFSFGLSWTVENVLKTLFWNGLSSVVGTLQHEHHEMRLNFDFPFIWIPRSRLRVFEFQTLISSRVFSLVFQWWRANTETYWSSSKFWHFPILCQKFIIYNRKLRCAYDWHNHNDLHVDCIIKEIPLLSFLSPVSTRPLDSWSGLYLESWSRQI